MFILKNREKFFPVKEKAGGNVNSKGWAEGTGRFQEIPLTEMARFPIFFVKEGIYAAMARRQDVQTLSC